MDLNEEIPLDTNYALVPAAPDGWERNGATAVPIGGNPRVGDGWHGSYTRTINGLTGTISLYSDPDTDTVKITLREHKEGTPENTLRKEEQTVPEVEELETLETVATEWVEKTENSES